MTGLVSTGAVLAAVLRSGPLRRLLSAYLLFRVAEVSSWLAILVWAFGRGGAKAAGFVALLQLAPAALLAPLGSVLGDRLPRSRALAVGYCAQCVSMVATGVVLVAGAPFAVVAAVAASAAVAVTLTRPVHQAILPDIVATPAQLTAGNSLTSTADGVASLVGPAASGALLAAWGAGAVFVAVGLGVGLAALLINGLVVRPPVVRLASERVVRSALAGFRQLRGDSGAALLLLLVGTQFLIVGLIDVLVVLLALQILHIGAAGAGLLASALGAGALVGGAATVLLIGRRRLAPAVVVGVVATGAPIAMLGVAPSPAATVLLLAACGAGGAFLSVGSRTLLQRSTSSETLARIFGIQEGLTMAGLALGSILAPALATWFGPRGAFVAAGTLLPLVGLLVWTRIRVLDQRHQPVGTNVGLLGALPIFAPLPIRTLESLSAALVQVRAAAGDVVILEGEIGDLYYVVQSGELAVTRGGHDIRVLHKGSGFGEIALLRQVPRTASVTARTDCVLLALDRVTFLSAVTGAPRSLVAAGQVIDGHLAADTAADPAPSANEPGVLGQPPNEL